MLFLLSLQEWRLNSSNYFSFASFTFCLALKPISKPTDSILGVLS